FVYWIEPGGVSRLDLGGGGDSEKLVDAGVFKPSGLALGDDGLYWTNSCDDAGDLTGCCQASIRRADNAGSPVPLKAPPQLCPLDPAVSGRSSFWVNGSSPTTSIVCALKDGGGVQSLGAAVVNHLAADGTFLYYAAQSGGGYDIFQVRHDLSPRPPI